MTTDGPGALRVATSAADAGQLVRAATPEVYAYAMRLTAGDADWAHELVQTACVELVRALRGGAVGLEVSWLVVVVRRRFLDDLRRRHREADGLTRLASVRAADVAPGAFDTSTSAVFAALRSMAADQRAALVLRYVDDLPVAEVASALGRSVAATESLLARGRRGLAALVARDEGADRSEAT